MKITPDSDAPRRVETEELLVDEIFQPAIDDENAPEVQKILKDFISSYVAHKDDMALKDWLGMELREHLPEATPEEIETFREDILKTIEVDEKERESLSHAASMGRSNESWLARELKRTTSHMTAQYTADYLQKIDQTLSNANSALIDTITTKEAIISQNRNLDGFIAEQYHAQTFNLNAEAAGSKYHAEVVEPVNGVYGKNSVDLVIKDDSGHIIRRYQSKYYKDAKATEKAFEKGDYRGQRSLVPDDQIDEIQKKCNSIIEAPDGTTSNPLTKDKAKEMQEEAQSGNWNELNWSEYKTSDLAAGIAKKAGQSALLGAAVGTGIYMAEKTWNGEEIDSEEVVETALSSGADFGIKAAAGGALKVCAEKNLIKLIPKGTPASTCANIAFVVIENVKVMGKVASGELQLPEALDEMEKTTVSTVAGMALSGLAVAKVGAAVGTVFGPVGTAVGGFIGGTIGFIAGSKAGAVVAKGHQKIRNAIKDHVANVVDAGKELLSSVGSRLKSIFA